MSKLRRRYCIFGCDALVTYGVPHHRFPNPDKRPDLFAAWMTVVGSKVTETDRTKVFNNKRICDHHFDPSFKTTGGHLIRSAIPTLNLDRVQQTISTFVETDHTYCGRRKESGHARPVFDIIIKLPSPSRSEPSSDVDSTEFAAPSESPCMMSSEQSPARTPLMKIDEDKTFEYPQIKVETQEKPDTQEKADTQKKAETQKNAETQKKADTQKNAETQKKAETRKTRQMQNEICRLRQKVKTLKLRLKKVENKSANKDFEKLSRNMSESAKLFTRMQCVEGQKKKKGHRFTQEEKILSASILKNSPNAYKFMSKHFTLPSKKVLKSLLV